MDTKQLETIKENLLAEKKRMEATLGSVSAPDKGEHVPGNYEAKFPNYGDDPATELEDNSPTEVADFQSNLTVTSDLSEELARINAALAKIAAGTYGTCEKCGKAIDPQRLKAYPAAAHCMDCSK